jgi:hypothetical protein
MVADLVEEQGHAALRAAVRDAERSQAISARPGSSCCSRLPRGSF